jgi:transposase InsO family protein
MSYDARLREAMQAQDDDPHPRRRRRRRPGRARLHPVGAEPAWASDIKYVPTWEGTLYLVSVIDCFARRVVGWAMHDEMLAEALDEHVRSCRNRTSLR